jgi:hypothetical protein
MGWRAATYDLSALKGQNVQLMFQNRNLHGGISLGIWTYVDDVRVLGYPYSIYLPVIVKGQ